MAKFQSHGARKSTGRCPQLALALIMCLLAFTTAPGCSGPSWTDRGGRSAPDRGGGILAASLSAEERERREVVRRLFGGIVAGQEVAAVARWLPGVEFRETQAAFLAGNLLLRRWEFAAPFRPDGIPVILEFVPADDATANKAERRTYEVTGRRGRWVVDRVAAERLAP